MTGIIHFETFLLAGILLNLTPGNDTIFILTKSITQGKKAGLISAMGIATGCMVHTILAALGLSIIIVQSLLLFTFIKYVGAAYLVYLGFKMLTDKSSFASAATAVPKSHNYLRLYRQAILTNILNPKVALFFIAFLPQFIDPAANHTVLPFLILGSTFILTGTLWCFVLAIFASTIFAQLKHNKQVSGIINKVCGLTLIGLGIKVALTNRKS